MSYKILITPDAVNQIDEAVKYYKERVSAKVASAFLKDYRSTIKEILKVRYFQVLFLNFHGRNMKKSPYLIFYTIDEKSRLIIVKAVFHTSQDPVNYPK